MLDRRASTRRRTLLEGHLVTAALEGWGADCSVRNLGEGGACIMIPEHVLVPSAFEIAISGKAPQAARLVWYGSGRAGVAFTARAA